MGLSNLKRIIAFLMIVTVSTAFVVGCGDGKGKRRARTNRSLDTKPTDGADGKQSQQNEQQDDQQEAADGGADNELPPLDEAGQQEPPAEDATVADAETARANSEAVQRIESALTSLTDSGTTIDKNSLEEGKYKLTNVVSAVRYMYKTVDARAMQTLQLSELSDGRVQLNQTDLQTIGVISDHSVAARALEIALSFEVKKENGAFTAARTAFSPVILNTSVTNQLAVSTGLASSVVDASPIASSMIDMLGRSAQGSSDITYSMNDENGRLLVMRLRKVSETELRVVVSIEEEKMQDNDVNSALIARDIVLTYSFEKAVAASDTGLILTEPDQGAGADAGADAATTTTATAGQDDDVF